MKLTFLNEVLVFLFIFRFFVIIFFELNQIYIFFSKIPRYFQAKPEIWQEVYHSLHPSLTAFIAEATFIDKMQELNRNTASEASFVQRFYRWFDAFQIIKYLNFNHSPENKIPFTDAAYQFLCQHYSNTAFTKNTYELLMYFRSLEKIN